MPSGKFLKVRVQGPSRNSAEKRVLALRDEWQKMGTDANSKEAGSQQHFQTINNVWIQESPRLCGKRVGEKPIMSENGPLLGRAHGNS